MITDEQARAAMDALEPDGVKSQYRQLAAVLCKWGRQELSRREQHDDGPITAEWCRENGARYCGRHAVWQWSFGDCLLCWRDADDLVAIKGAGGVPIKTRRQLLALLAALRGEPSGNPGQLPAVGPQRAAPSSPAKIEAETRAVRGRLDGT